MSNQETKSIWKVISASSMGTMIEWYDFYIFGSLAVVISTKFFPADNPTAAFLSTLATFAAGFVVRPFGALFFGRLGDLIGRKYTFMVTLLLMGGATFMIGCIPSYETIGFMAPLLVLILRLLQGLALGGEYGGAATYVAEHAPKGQKGYWTSWIQTTATVGLFISLMVILATKNILSKEAFDEWGWRVPFWVSILMVLVSYLIRKNMHESPVFAKAKAEGTTSTNPLKESFGNKYNLKFVLLALFGATMGQGVVWYTGQFYAMNFLKTVQSIDSSQVDTLLGIALLLGTPFFIVFGWLSDKIGRKTIMMGGMLLAILLYRPIYRQMYQSTDSKAMKEKGITMVVDSCKALGGPIATIKTEADKKDPSIKKTRVFVDFKTDSVYSNGAVFHYTKTDTLYLAKELEFDAKASGKNETWIKFDSKGKDGAVVHNTVKVKNDLKEDEKAAKVDTLQTLALNQFTGGEAKHKSHINGISEKANVAVVKNITNDVRWFLIFLIFVQVLFVTMVYGPIAAFLVEMFPVKIRYTSMSLPYHVGNGIFGGLLPAISTYFVTAAKNNGDPEFYLEGLWYPIVIAAVCFVIGMIYIDRKINTLHD
ncbi:MFS transporter [Flavobacterium sp. SUN046]|uniref:MFS transporter n=1 Tax=Flavobacterium sp. SUN046 TaxID=3002440 RepID=UPI002DB8E187|nr:MFS transporter [Flavobacterium sp. SUN046]MEC4048386.1 MFS transporter [Flavobacterium sp. SUN046]